MISSVEKLYLNSTWTNTYKLTYSDGTVWDVPHDTDNRHYQEILEWVAAGNTITDPGA